MKITILTLFPEMFSGPFAHSIVKNAQGKKLLTIRIVNIRDFGLTKHKTVDDTPYGGGIGMILRVDVLKNAIDSVVDKRLSKDEQRIILTSAKGKTFEQEKAKELSNFKHLIIICGHYEGVDERILQYIDEEISIGDFILTGGEIPAMIITDVVTRLIKNVLKPGVTDEESFSPNLEYPQYTKPQNFNNQKIPDVLLSGNHKEIAAWRKEKAMQLTKMRRPDLLKK